MPSWWCGGSTSRFDSDPHSVCPAWCTNARRIVTVYYHVLISSGGEGGSGALVPSFVPDFESEAERFLAKTAQNFGCGLPLLSRLQKRLKLSTAGPIVQHPKVCGRVGCCRNK